MRTSHAAALIAAGAFALAATTVGLTTMSPQAVAAAPAAPGKAAPPPLEILDFKPGFDDMMTMLVQPRHIKLWLAGQQRNWTLAAFQLNELAGALRRIGATIPKYQNFSVDATTGSIFQPKIAQMNSAIRAQNPMLFATAFNDLTEACNACHEGMNHAFLVVKVPDASAANLYPNQDFRPVPGLTLPGAPK